MAGATFASPSAAADTCRAQVLGRLSSEIARVLTEIRAREIDAADALEAAGEEVAD